MKRLVSGIITICMVVSMSLNAFALPQVNTQLSRGNWDETVYNRLNQLISTYSINNDNYDIRNKPYAVFDFDNTTSMNDIEEALLIYQLVNLEFKMSPSKLDEVLKTNVPKDMFSESYNNADGKSLNIDIVAGDAVSSYTYLYNNYVGLAGNKSLEEVKKAPQYQDFITKVRYLYDAIGGTFSPDVSYPWVTYLFYGMTPAEVYRLAERSTDYWLNYNRYESVKWTSPADLPGNAGVVSVSYKTGLRIMPEMVELYNTLMNNGIEVYILSASFKDVIFMAGTNPKYGLNVDPAKVFAMELLLDDNGRYTNQYNSSVYYQTQGEGKTLTIEKYIAPNHGGKGPILVAGDSDGDYYMMSDFKDMKIGLIINRVRGGNIGALSKKAADSMGNPDAVYLLQGRDDNIGLFRQSPMALPLGSKTEQLVR